MICKYWVISRCLNAWHIVCVGTPTVIRVDGSDSGSSMANLYNHSQKRFNRTYKCNVFVYVCVPVSLTLPIIYMYIINISTVTHAHTCTHHIWQRLFSHYRRKCIISVSQLKWERKPNQTNLERNALCCKWIEWAQYLYIQCMHKYRAIFLICMQHYANVTEFFSSQVSIVYTPHELRLEPLDFFQNSFFPFFFSFFKF